MTSHENLPAKPYIRPGLSQAARAAVTQAERKAASHTPAANGAARAQQGPDKRGHKAKNAS